MTSQTLSVFVCAVSLRPRDSPKLSVPRGFTPVCWCLSQSVVSVNEEPWRSVDQSESLTAPLWEPHKTRTARPDPRQIQAGLQNHDPGLNWSDLDRLCCGLYAGLFQDDAGRNDEEEQQYHWVGYSFRTWTCRLQCFCVCLTHFCLCAGWRLWVRLWRTYLSRLRTRTGWRWESTSPPNSWLCKFSLEQIQESFLGLIHYFRDFITSLRICSHFSVKSALCRFCVMTTL